MRVPAPEDFPSRLRSPAVAARVGVWLGICFGICFLTGLISHYAQDPGQPIPFPTNPSWGYRVTQGLHVLTGIAAIPLLLVKLWAVYPRLFLRPPRDVRALIIDGLERVSIAVLVAAAIFELTSGLLNITRWYPWDFSFRSTHYAVAWIAIGSLLLHIAVKLAVIRDVLGADIDAVIHDRATATEPGALTRRGLVRTTWLAAGTVVLANAGASVPALRRVSVFAVNSGDGPMGIPINKTASAADVTAAATSAGYALEIRYDGAVTRLTLSQLTAMEQRTETLPDRLRRGVERVGHLDRRPAPRPPRPRRRAGGERRTHLLAAAERPVPEHDAAGQLRRRRPHPARPPAQRRAAGARPRISPAG